jgi:hypothetical protein
VNGIDPDGLMTVGSMMSSIGIQNMVRVGTGYIQTAFRIYNIVDRVKKVIDYGTTINKMLQLAACMWDGMNGGVPLTQSFLTALTQVFNFDAGMPNLSQMFVKFDEIFKEVSQDQLKELLRRVAKNAGKIAGDVISHRRSGDGKDMTEMIKAALSREDFIIVLGLPSQPFGKLPPVWLKTKVNREDYAFGWSGYPGVLLDIGLAIDNPKTPYFKRDFPQWHLGHAQSVARIDYWYYGSSNNIFSGGYYNPHYHVWNDAEHRDI